MIIKYFKKILSFLFSKLQGNNHFNQGLNICQYKSRKIEKWSFKSISLIIFSTEISKKYLIHYVQDKTIN